MKAAVKPDALPLRIAYHGETTDDTDNTDRTPRHRQSLSWLSLSEISVPSVVKNIEDSRRKRLCRWIASE